MGQRQEGESNRMGLVPARGAWLERQIKDMASQATG